jgi:hypothetical protein
MSRHHAAARTPIRARHLIPAAIAVAAALPSGAQAAEGRFAAGTDLPASAPLALAAADFDNDGHTDLAAIVKLGVQIYLQSPEGKLEPKGQPIQSGASPVRVATGDFDRDGNDDLAVADSASQRLWIHNGGGNGVFASGEDIDVGLGYHATDVEVGDFNGDTYDDLAVPAAFTTGSTLTRIYTGGPDPAWTAQPAAGGHVAALVAAHVDRDDDTDTFDDLVLAADNAAALRVKPAVGGGAFEGGPSFALDSAVAGPDALAPADVDGNGRVDLVAVTKTGSVGVLRNRGDGSYDAFKPAPLGAVGSRRALAVADFDGDAHEDIAVADDAGDGTVHVLLGDGNAGFRTAPDVRVGKTPSAIAAGDFDADGVIDLATANTGSDTISIRPGTGPAPLEGNLLANGGFEGPTPSGKLQPIGIVGWELQGESSWVRYSAPSHSYTPTTVDSARFNGGRRMFWGGRSSGSDGITGARQSVDVGGYASGIDAGQMTARLSAYLGGALAYDDAAQARADFLDVAGTVKGTLRLGPVTPADRHHVTTLLHRAGEAAVPAGTRRIEVTVTSVDADKAFSSATADNVKLTLATTPPLVIPEPDPGTGTPRPTVSAAFGADPFVRFTPVRTRLRAGEPLRLRASNGNPFDVRGQVRIKGTRGARPLTVPADGRATVRLALPARVRTALRRRHRAKVTISANVVDGEGNARTVTRRIALKRKAVR